VLQHVTLELRRDDWPAAKRFWSMVGFEEVEPPGTLGDRSAWVERAGTQIHLQWQDEPVAPPQGHAAVVVEDWDGVVARLRDEGFEVDERPRHWGAGRPPRGADGRAACLDGRDRVSLPRPGPVARAVGGEPLHELAAQVARLHDRVDHEL
jgi:hypothetical protein